MRRGEPEQKTHGTHGFCGHKTPEIEGATDSNHIQDVKGDTILTGFISGIKPELKALDKKLKEIRKKANGAASTDMHLSANLVINSTKSGKGKKPLSQPDFQNYEIVLTWGDDSDNVQKRRKLELEEIPSPSGTEWKISIKPLVAGGPKVNDK